MSEYRFPRNLTPEEFNEVVGEYLRVYGLEVFSGEENWIMTRVGNGRVVVTEEFLRSIQRRGGCWASRIDENGRVVPRTTRAEPEWEPDMFPYPWTWVNPEDSDEGDDEVEYDPNEMRAPPHGGIRYIIMEGDEPQVHEYVEGETREWFRVTGNLDILLNGGDGDDSETSEVSEIESDLDFEEGNAGGEEL